MARIDKYDPISGGFRAPLAADWAADPGVPIGVGLDAQGRVVPGAANSGVKGIVVDDGLASPYGTRAKSFKAGDIVDVMTSGELVDCTGLNAGTTYFVNGTTGALEATAPAAGANKILAGHTVEAQRLVVRTAQVQG